MITGLGPYRAYREPGTPWLPAVPRHWEVGTLRRRLRPYDGIKIGPFGSQLKLESMVSAGYKVFGQANVIAGDFARGQKFVTREKFEELKACELCPGDIVLTMMGTSGRCALVPDGSPPGLMDSHLLRLRTDATVTRHFAALVLGSAPYVQEQVGVAGKGSIMHGLNSGIVKDLLIAVPSVEEQTAIVRFLDYMDRRIRRYIRAKQKLIKLLEEQKQAIIHRAVTRGLDPNVRLKPSGVEWLGEVPEHWGVEKLKRCLRAPLAYGVLKPDKYDGAEAVPIIRILDVSEGVISRDRLERISPRQDAEFARTRVAAGDVLVSVVGTIGRSAVVPRDLGHANLSRALCRVQLNRLVSPGFLHAYTQSRAFMEQADSVPAGTAQRVLNLGDLRQFDVTVPPAQEQAEILRGLSQMTATLASGVAAGKHAISLLYEYRTRLIADVVTGKLDVREAAAALIDEAAEPGSPEELEIEATSDGEGGDVEATPEEAEA